MGVAVVVDFRKCADLAREITRDRKAATTSEESEAVWKRAEEALADCAESWALRGSAAWALYQARIRNAAPDVPPHDTFETVLRIGQLVDPNRYGPVSCWVTAVNETLERWSKSTDNSTALLAVDLLGRVDRTSLAREKSDFNGQTYPSQTERFYDAASKILSRRGHHELLVRLADEGLEEGVMPTGEKRGWVHFRLARAILESDPPRARANLLRALEVAREVAKLSLLVRANRLCNLQDEALEVATEAVLALDAKDLPFNTRLFVDLAEMTENDTIARLCVTIAQNSDPSEVAVMLHQLRRSLRRNNP